VGVERSVEDKLSGLPCSNERQRRLLNIAEMMLPPGERDRMSGRNSGRAEAADIVET
jgi:hypothetical protein